MSAAQQEAQEVTQLLLAWNRGDESALEKLIPLVHDELRRLARRQMRREHPEHSLQTTGLINEAPSEIGGSGKCPLAESRPLLCTVCPLNATHFG
jgi:hypothetical protein